MFHMIATAALSALLLAAPAPRTEASIFTLPSVPATETESASDSEEDFLLPAETVESEKTANSFHDIAVRSVKKYAPFMATGGTAVVLTNLGLPLAISIPAAIYVGYRTDAAVNTESDEAAEAIVSTVESFVDTVMGYLSGLSRWIPEEASSIFEN